MTSTKQLIKDFDTDADNRMALICRIMIVLMTIVILLNALHVFKISHMIYPTIIFSIIIMSLPTVIYNFLHKHSKAARYFVLTLVVFMAGFLYSILSYHVIIMLVFPIVVSCLYCDRKCVWFTTLLSIPVMVVSHLIAFSLKVVPDEPLITLKGTLIYGVVPRVIELLAIAIICISVTNKLQKLIKELIKKNDELYEEQEIIVSALAELVEAQSHETGKHVKRVAAYTEILCKALEMPEEETWKVRVASMMHDVGKIGVSHEILHKQGRLTEDEFAEVKKHVAYGHQLLENSPGEIMRVASDIAWQHHERYDGKGYLNGFKGKEIKLYARCVAIADVFDALVSKRCYKEAWSPEAARKEILSQSGKQFDPEITTLFDRHFKEFLSVMEQYPDE